MAEEARIARISDTIESVKALNFGDYGAINGIRRKFQEKLKFTINYYSRLVAEYPQYQRPVIALCYANGGMHTEGIKTTRNSIKELLAVIENTVQPWVLSNSPRNNYVAKIFHNELTEMAQLLNNEITEREDYSKEEVKEAQVQPERKISVAFGVILSIATTLSALSFFVTGFSVALLTLTIPLASGAAVMLFLSRKSYRNTEERLRRIFENSMASEVGVSPYQVRLSVVESRSASLPEEERYRANAQAISMMITEKADKEDAILKELEESLKEK